MNTEQAIELLSASLDRPLTTVEQASLEGWLAADPEHRALADGLKQQHADLKTTFEPRREAVAKVIADVTNSLPVITPPPMPAMRPSDPSKPVWQRLANPYSSAIAAALVIGLGLAVFRGKNPNQNPIDDFSRFSGNEVALTIGMHPREKPAEPKTKTLNVGETITTAAGDKRRVMLPDGSTLYLNQNSKVKLAEDRLLVLTSGDVFIEAIPATVAKTKFVVETPARSVTALGTKFAVSAAETGTGVIVTQGKVQVSDVAEPVASGQQLSPKESKPIQAPRGACAVEWTRDLVIAAEAPLVPAGEYSGGSLVAVDPYGQEAKLKLVNYHVDVHVEEGFARTTIDQTFFNNEIQQLEGTFYFPLPPDASLNRLAMYVDGTRMEGGMAERDHARNVYERIRHQRRDPALLEWVDGSVFKMRVFPLPAREEKRIILSYTQKLNSNYGRSTYRFPSGHSLSHVEQWSFQARLKNAGDWSVGSSSHPKMKIVNDGNDVVLTDKAQGARIDRDVVVEMADHSEAARQPESTRWSMFAQDGQRYLMMRYKPDLPNAGHRERRDWVFLFESSGARDPLVARAQVEVIRSLLNHAEHEDTFTVMTVGTRVREFGPGLIPATGENVAKAIQWLEQTHLIGALNIEEAFNRAASRLQSASNPHVVHVGSGIASYGEQRTDLLIQKLPAGAKYVGVAVGRRFSTTLMKTAAEKSGGLFTQINPDEPVAWKGFEVASSLNAPRLLNIKLETPGRADLRFLSFAGSVAHGEEIVAIARLTNAPPAAVKVSGMLDGAPYEKMLPMGKVEEGAGHLPRSWAKLEIDRLLAENSSLHQHTITELSKAMYVMTPYTSLLVLENEQMYREFNVDRGRKDHWAMYPAPDKIPVVYVPDPNMPMARGAIAGQKPHEMQVLSTILTRQVSRVLQGPGIPGQQQPILNAAQYFGPTVAMPEVVLQGVERMDGDLDELEALKNEDLGMASDHLERSFNKTQRSYDLTLKQKVVATDETRRQRARITGLVKGELDRKSLWHESNQPRKALGEFSKSRSELRKKAMAWDDGAQAMFGTTRSKRDAERMFDGEEFGVRLLDRQAKEITNGLPHLQTPSGDLPISGSNAPTDRMFTWELKQKNFDGESKLNKLSELSDLRAERGVARFLAKPAKGLAPEGRPMVELMIPEPSRGAVDDAPVDSKNFTALRDARYGFNITPPAYYTRPTFAFSERLFRDLASFAPGMSSQPADVRAVVEAEAAPRFGFRRGSIDAGAKKLFDDARASMGWRVIQILLPNGEKLPVTHDGLGRYVYERTVAFGLREQVVCDGKTLWHSYPEIGLGAKRTVSRFHRAEFLELIPDGLPPVEDLNFGADVKLHDATTVVVSAHHEADENGNINPYFDTYYKFANGRLAEVYSVLQPDGKNSSRLVFSSMGSMMVIGKVPTMTASGKFEISLTKEPNLKPANQGLVVLPLPLRTRDIVMPRIGLDPNYGPFDGTNECWAYLGDAELNELLASEFASGSGNISTIINHLKYGKNDRRPGLDVLLASQGYPPRTEMFVDADHESILRSDPLSRYLYREFDNDTREWNKKFGFSLPAEPKTDFLSKLSTLRVIYDRFAGPHTRHPWWGIRVAEVNRALKFVEQNESSSLGWAALGIVSDAPLELDHWMKIADAWGVMAKKSPFPYQARYEQARSLSRAGHGNEALVKYRELFREALAVGVLPSVDDQFRVVLSQFDEGEWPNLMKEMAKKCAGQKARPVVVLLAWQCWQLGDIALSDTMLEAAASEMTDAEAPLVRLWAAQFLNATNRYDRSDAFVRALLADKRTKESPLVWRLASQVADARQDQVRSMEYLEKALDLEFASMPDTFDINPIRNDYGRLLSHYEWLADAAVKLKVPTPNDLPTRLIRSADRWRQLDPEPDGICTRVGVVLRKIGSPEAEALAWDYETTPLALKPNDSGPWEALANRLRTEGDWKLADRAYELAWLAEPTNAQLLWNRAQHLKEKGQIAESRKVFLQLANGQWQERFRGLASMAKAAANGQ